MKLYHYSASPRNPLLSKRAQGNLTAEEIARDDKRSKMMGTIAPYIDHISFFFDPLPLVLLAELFKPTGEFKEKHHTWVKGKQLFEHVIETDQLDNGCSWEVVESFKSIAFFDEFVEEHNWVDDDPEKLRLYLEQAKQNSIRWGERGHGVKDLNKQIRLFENTTEKAYQTARLRSDFGENRMKYAANVPHLMLYPFEGRVAVQYVNEVEVGKFTRKRVPGV